MNRRGFALVATLFAVVLVGALIAYAAGAAVNVTRTSGADYHGTRADYTAEAGAEHVMAQLHGFLRDGHIDSTEIASISPPTTDFPDWSWPGFGATRVGAPATESITDGPFAGLLALTEHFRIDSRAVDASGASARVLLDVKAQAIPLFQFGVFFEDELEATNGPPMDFLGRVHSNGPIYLCSGNAWYREMVTTPDKIFLNRMDFDYTCPGVYIDDASGSSVQLTFDSRDTPDPQTFIGKSETFFDSRLQTDAYNVPPLRVPLPEGMTPRELVKPRDAADPPLVKESKYAWFADLHIDPPVEELAAKSVCDVVTDAAAKIPQCQDAVQFSWEAFYDMREGYYVDLLDLDVSELPADLQIVYVHFNPAWVGSDAAADGVHPAIRIWNGATLNGPLTIVSDAPIYVQGDYNTIDKKPASLIGDAITILSNGWSDDRHVCYLWNNGSCDAWGTVAATSYRSPATQTAVNAALMLGMVRTPCDWFEATCAADGSTSYYQDWYSGGLENAPRFLENWSGVTLRWRGSLVSLYESEHATGTWNGSYYSPPVRDWGFDIDFLDPANLPPGTPLVGQVLQTGQRPGD